MNELETFYITTRLSGRLTQLPDSQKIFGALIYLYADVHTPEETSKFVSKIKEKELYFALSNMLPIGYLPVPIDLFIDKINTYETKIEDKQASDSKELYKKLKKREFLKIDELKNTLKNGKTIDLNATYVYEKSSQQIHAAIDCLTYNLPGLDPNLYSTPEVTIIEVNKNARTVITEFGFYLSCDENEEIKSLLFHLEKAKENKKLIFLGPRGSQGLNTYTITNIKKLNEDQHKIKQTYSEDNTIYLNTGMLLPNKINFEQSLLKLHTSERRPYEQLGGWDKDQQKKFISFIQPGSIISSKEKLSDIGKSIDSPFGRKGAIIFGNAYLTPIEINEGGQ